MTASLLPLNAQGHVLLHLAPQSTGTPPVTAPNAVAPGTALNVRERASQP